MQRLKPATENAIFRWSSANMSTTTLAKVGRTFVAIDAGCGKRSPREPLAALTSLGAHSPHAAQSVWQPSLEPKLERRRVGSRRHPEDGTAVAGFRRCVCVRIY